MRKIIFAAMSLVFMVSCIAGPAYQAKKGVKQFEAGRYKKAVKNLEAARKKDALDARMKITLGATYINLARYKDAVAILSASAGDNPEAWFLLGNAYYNLDELEEAAIAYRMAISLKADYLDAIEALAMLHPDGGVSREEALKLWRRALEIETRDEWITRAKHYIEQLEAQ